MRGQVNLLLLALLCGTAAATLRGRRFRAGLFLAGAICIKVIPAFLLLFPLWRRDGRCLLGCLFRLRILLLFLLHSAHTPRSRTDSSTLARITRDSSDDYAAQSTLERASCSPATGCGGWRGRRSRF
jgi:hypothetical protein